MDTKVGSREKKGEGSAWMARLGAPARRFRRASIEKERTTNGHEWARKTQNHEWTRMGMNGHEKLRTTNGRECTRKEGRGLLNHEWARMDTNGHEYLWSGGYYPRSHVGCPQLWTGCNAPSPHSSPICQVACLGLSPKRYVKRRHTICNNAAALWTNDQNIVSSLGKTVAMIKKRRKPFRVEVFSWFWLSAEKSALP